MADGDTCGDSAGVRGPVPPAPFPLPVDSRLTDPVPLGDGMHEKEEDGATRESPWQGLAMDSLDAMGNDLSCW